MPEAEVLYSEVQFGSGARGCTNATTSSSDQTTYSEVRILEREAAAERPVSQQGAAELKGPAQVRRRDVALLVLSLLLAAAVSALAASLYQNVQTKDELQKLKRNLSDLENKNTEITDELQKLKSCNEDLEKSVLGQSCLTCERDWEQHGGRCYNFSSTTSSWTKSKENCRDLGGDLVKIDSREEQTFLLNKVKYSGDLFWIGLTDSDTEGDWKWTDGSALDECLSFWRDDQPDDYKGQDPDGEDCVLIGNQWADFICQVEFRWICEKEAEQEQFQACRSV